LHSISHLIEHHVLGIVAIPTLVCFVSSFIALKLLAQARASTAWRHAGWLLASGFAVGAGTWCTHFIAMLGYDPGLIVDYDRAWTLISLAIPILTSTVGLVFFAHAKNALGMAAAGVAIGAGLAVMHYTGMYGVRIPGRFEWDTAHVAVSVLAVCALTPAALIVFASRITRQPLMAAASLFTVGIAVLHFVGMGAVTAVPDPSASFAAGGLPRTTLALAIAAAMLAMLGFAALGLVSERLRRFNQELKAKTAQLDAALSNMSQGLCLYDAENRLLLSNTHFSDIYKIPHDVMQPGTLFADVVEATRAAGSELHPDAEPSYEARLASIRERKRGMFQERLVDRRTVAISHVPLEDGGWVATYEDISGRERMANAVEEQRARLDAALTNLPHGLCMFDAEKRLILCNARYAALYDLPPHLTQPGTRLSDILAFRQAAGTAPINAENYSADRQDLTDHNWKLQDGRTIRISYQQMPNGGYVASHVDITDTIRAEAQIAHMAHHDALTNLPNRVLFRLEMERALARVQRGEAMAVLCLDLDRFKAVNDTLGHQLGDALLKQVADRLRASLRDADAIARLGGDEFAIVQVGGDQPEQAAALARRLIESLSAPYYVDGHHVVIGTSIGISLAPSDGREPDQLLKAADLALYRAKAEGRNAFRFFEAAMDARMRDRRHLEADLRNALANGEFELHYQPLVHLGTNAVSGFEALLRWTHPTRGPVSPAEFVPIAEEIGLINKIGAWVLRQACADAATWPEHVRLAVNISPAQFRGRTLLLDVVAALGASRLSASRLELEITETVLLRDTEATLGVLRQLKELGVHISMDDFGTGYSSLSYLRKFPFDKIKIDQTFIRDLPEEPGSVAIIRAVMALGTSLGMQVTAEGVETEAQLDRLREEGVTEAQGWLFSKARPASELAELLAVSPRRERRSAA